MWKEKWCEAYQKASFYTSTHNTDEFWNNVAAQTMQSTKGYSLLQDENLIQIIVRYLKENQKLKNDTTILDVGCGTGDYLLALAPECGHITALDYSKVMIELASRRIAESKIVNIDFQLADFNSYESEDKYDIVLAALNPAVYSPQAFDKLVGLSKKVVVLFNQSGDLEKSENEPIYAGTQLAEFPINYANELGIKCDIVPYTYQNIPFKYSIYYK